MLPLLLLGALLVQPAGGAGRVENPAGVWSFRGSCPVSRVSYSGRLTIAGTGPTYTLVWSDGVNDLHGRGLRDRDHLSVEFNGGGDHAGLMHMRRWGGGWRGTWAYYGRRETCTESWWRG